MTPSDSPSPLAQAIEALAGERWSVALARERVRPVPGLYAIYGDTQAWTDLGLDPQPGSALYVGKSEDNLVQRELNTHFAADPNKNPRTGSSTVRRSFAALLRDRLDLHAVPRNPDRPGYFSNYGLTHEGDARLTAWMHERLTLAFWERPAGLAQTLKNLEVAIIHRWTPLMNIRDNPSALPRLRLARQVMARQAANSQTAKMVETTKTARVLPPLETGPVALAGGFTPVELARELGLSPKTVRQALRDKYGKLPLVGARWGSLTPEQESYLRARFR